MKTSVVHCRKSKFDIYIGRPSKWGNPFKLGAGNDRETVLEQYRKWLMEQEELLADLHELRGKTLGCWCKPDACHGDILAELAEALVLIPETAKKTSKRKKAPQTVASKRKSA